MAKIAVIINDRQAEALRSSLGLTAVHDTVDIYFTAPIEDNEEVQAQMEAIKDLELKTYSAVSSRDSEDIDVETLADKLLEYDAVIPF